MSLASDLDARPGRSRLRRWLLFWGGLAVGAVFLALTARGTDVRAQLAIVRDLPTGAWAWIAVAFVLEVPHVAIRAMRWSRFFPAPHLPRVRMLSAMAIGYLYNNLIPRSGELVRMVLVGRWRPDLGIAGTGVTIGADRLVDVLMVLVMSSIVIGFSPYGLGELAPQRRSFWVVVGVVLGVTAVVLALVRFARPLERWALERFRRLPERLARVAETPTRHLFDGLDGLGRLSPAARRGLVFWVVLELSLTLVMHSITARAFGVHMPWYDVVFVVAASGFGAMVPSGPGNAGSMIFAVSVAAEHTAISHAAAAYGLVFFCTYFVMRTVLGLTFLVLETRRARAVALEAGDQPKRSPDQDPRSP